MDGSAEPPIGHLIRSTRRQRGMSQYDLADRLATIAGRPTMGRDRVARWERGRQVPRAEWRQWLSVVLDIPPERLDASAAAALRQNRLGHVAATANAPVAAGAARRLQGTPALLPVLRSRVQAGILAATLLNPGRAFSLTELADHAGGSLASVSKESRLLEAAGILTTRTDGAIRLIRAVTDKPILQPLTELIRGTYGVPQVVGEEFGAVPGVVRIALTGAWAQRFAGTPGPEPDRIQVRLTVAEGSPPDETALRGAGDRARRRLRRPVVYRTIPLPEARGAVLRQGPGSPVVQVLPPRAAGVRPVAPTWAQGAETVHALLDEGQLELFSGPGAECESYFTLAEHHIGAAEDVMAATPGSAFLLTSQAAALIGAGLLAVQGLRPAAGSGHDVVGRAVTAQFGPQFGQIELLRQRFAAMAHPTSRDNRASHDDARASIPAVRALLDAARALGDRLNRFA